MKVSLHALGCKSNQYDGERIVGDLLARGANLALDGEEPEVAVILTCTVTAASDAKSRALVRRIGSRYPGARIVVAGCYAELAPLAVGSLPGVAVVARRGEREGIGDALGLPVPSPAPQLRLRNWRGRRRPFVQVQEGCAEACSYCIVPAARGLPRSRPASEIVAEVECLVEAGAFEVVLTGTNLGVWGSEWGMGLKDLLSALAGIDSRFRVRLSSLNANHAVRALLELMASRPDRFCDHLHLPLQSGSDAILSAMRRGYRAADLLAVVARARALMPDVGFTTDVIVGFPGETEDDFAATQTVLREAGFHRVHVFPFSPRAGTRAAALDAVPVAIVASRLKKLSVLRTELWERFAGEMQGRELHCIPEPGGKAIASNYAPVLVKGHRGASPMRVKVAGTEAAALRGEPLGVGSAVGRSIGHPAW